MRKYFCPDIWVSSLFLYVYPFVLKIDLIFKFLFHCNTGYSTLDIVHRRRKVDPAIYKILTKILANLPQFWTLSEVKPKICPNPVRDFVRLKNGLLLVARPRIHYYVCPPQLYARKKNLYHKTENRLVDFSGHLIKYTFRGFRKEIIYLVWI